jgi:hypothetical protein
MISELDESIRQLLTTKADLGPAVADISFETPDREWSASLSKPTVNVYLYDIRENHELRRIEWKIAQDGSGNSVRKKTPSRVDLAYLITVWTNDVVDEHRLLWHVLLTLFRFPQLPEDVLSGRLSEQEYPIKTVAAQPNGLFSNPADFWTALDNEIKPFINYVVTVPLDTDVAFTAPLVRTKIVDIKPPETDAERLVQVAGIVHEKGKPDQPVTGARVVDREGRMTAETDDRGHYSFRKLVEGEHTFQVLVAGRKVGEMPVTVPAESYDLAI